MADSVRNKHALNKRPCTVPCSIILFEYVLYMMVPRSKDHRNCQGWVSGHCFMLACSSSNSGSSRVVSFQGEGLGAKSAAYDSSARCEN